MVAIEIPIYEYISGPRDYNPEKLKHMPWAGCRYADRPAALPISFCSSRGPGFKVWLPCRSVGFRNLGVRFRAQFRLGSRSLACSSAPVEENIASHCGSFFRTS